MNRHNKILYIINLFTVSFLVFLNIEYNLPSVRTPTYLITATSQKNIDSKNTEVWILNYKKSFLANIDQKKWLKKDGVYYSDGNKENYIKIKNQNQIIFIKHQWSGIVSIENTKTNEKEIIDLYSATGNSFIYNLEVLPVNKLSYYSIRTLIFFLIALLIHILIKLVLQIKIPKFKLKLKISDKTVFTLLILFSLFPIIYLIAFYPGLLSADSLDQWKQLTNFQLKDNHPAFHTLIYWLITRVYYSPISISIVQIICLSAIWIYGVKSIISNFKPSVTKKIFILFVSFIFFTSLQNGLMSITLWKDVLFSYSIFFLTINLFNIIFDKKWIEKNINKLLLISSLVFVFLLRHNGVLTYLGVSISLVLIYRTKFIKTILISFFIILLIKYPLYKLLKVTKIEGSVSAGYTLNYLNSYIYSNPILKEKYYNFYTNLYPKKDTDIFYSSYCGNYGATGLNYSFYLLNSNKINEYLKTEVINSPNILINEIKKRASLVWQIKQPSDSYTYISPIDDYGSRTTLKELYKIDSFNPDSKLTFFIRKLYYLSESDKYKSIFWRPALNLIVVLLISLYLLKKENNNLLFLPLIPILTLSAGLFLTIPGQDYRYLFSNFLISMYYVLLAIK